MQFAECWVGPRFSPRFGFVLLVIAFGAIGFVLAPQHHARNTSAHVDFDYSKCRGAAAASNTRIAKTETVDEILLAGHEADPYTPVFEGADLAHCFGDETRIEMLVDIAADGHVTRVTHRPERPNHASRCIARAVRHLQFPAADSPVSIRYAFTK